MSGNNKKQNALIILMKNPKKGHVKTRLAEDIGDENALKVYKLLLNHINKITKNLNHCDKFLFYSSYIDQEDEWDNKMYRKFIQKGDNLGDRMINVFEKALEEHKKAVLIVTDCFELSSEIIEKAFQELSKQDVVIGPDVDGGYYLIGMKKLYSSLFTNKNWSTETVCSETIQDIENLGLNYSKLKYLSDIDTIEDFLNSPLSNILKIEKRSS